MEFTEWEYEDLQDDLESTGEFEPTKENCTVAVCKLGFENFIKTDGSMSLVEVVEDVDVHYHDGAAFYMVDRLAGVHAKFICEAIAFETLEEFLKYNLECDVKEELVDKRILELKGKVDYFVVSNEIYE